MPQQCKFQLVSRRNVHTSNATSRKLSQADEDIIIVRRIHDETATITGQSLFNRENHHTYFQGPTGPTPNNITKLSSLYISLIPEYHQQSQ